jgi:hypothetical protein
MHQFRSFLHACVIGGFAGGGDSLAVHFSATGRAHYALNWA